ncbi:restriction endonuclease subunit S [Psychrobacter faecalis]
MVPNGWKLTSLGDISSKIQTGPFGSQLHAHEYTDEGIPVLMPKDLIDGRADINSAAKIPETRADDLVKHKLKKGDILFSRRGDVARFGLITEESEGALCGTGCLKASISKENSALFLSYFLQKSTVRKWLEQNAVGQTMLNLNTTILSELPIMVASSKQEQQKIANILATWDKAISATERLIENSTQQKKALMQQLLTGKKRLLDDNGKRFEGEWEEVNLSKVVKVTGGNAFKSAEFIKAGVPLVKISNIKPDYSVNVDTSVFVEYSQKHNRFEIKRGDILIAMSGATTGKVGKYEFDELAYLNQRVGRFDVKKSIIKDYLFQLLKLPKIQHNILIDAVGGAQPNISNKDIERIKVSLPSLEEQQKISTVLTNADKEIDLLEQQLADLQQEKKALMQVLLTGKKRVVV